MEISGKKAIIVGGASGMGRASAELQCIRLDAGQRFAPK
jgi:NAD(P)-dependent dehydrogenase (short-subunit alcohol dehydrogenase family)